MGKLACSVTGVFVAIFIIGIEAPARAADEAAAPKLATPEPGEPRKEAIDWRGINEAPVERQGVEVSPLVGYASNSFGFGAGLRAGYTFHQGLYLGAAFMYQHGVDRIPGDGSARLGVLYPSAEIGYDFRYESVSFRPYAGAGAGWYFASTSAGSQMGDPVFVTYPGLAITYRPERSLLFAGVDTRVLVPIGTDGSLSDYLSVGVYANAGLHF
jgi:hypothetical protein